MKRIILLVFTCFFLHTTYRSYADNENLYSTDVRCIIHTTNDSVVSMHVKLSSKGIEKRHNHIDYYWEKRGIIHKNQGSFSANILHGKYTVVNKKKLMITEGFFYNGMKDKCWKKWNSNGELTQIDFWRRGYLKKTELYSNGIATERVIYGKNGRPKAKLTYTADKIERYKYKDSSWIEKRKLFSKKQQQADADSLMVNAPK